jgi:hypothetical protein
VLSSLTVASDAELIERIAGVPIDEWRAYFRGELERDPEAAIRWANRLCLFLHAPAELEQGQEFGIHLPIEDRFVLLLTDLIREHCGVEGEGIERVSIRMTL